MTTEPIPPKRLLVIEDDYLLALNLSNELPAHGFEVCGQCASATKALREIEEKKPDVVLIDINLGAGGSGIDVAEYLSAHLKIPYVFLTAYSTTDIMSKALATAPYGYIVKPAKTIDIKAALETALTRRALEERREQSSKRLSFIAEQAKLGVWEYRDDNQLVEIAGAESLLACIGKSGIMELNRFLDLFPEDEQEKIRKKLQRGEKFSHRIKLNHHDQENCPSEIWLDIFVVDSDQNDGLVVLGAIMDVTRNVEFINKLESSHKLLESINGGFLTLTEDARIISASPFMVDIMGYTKEEILTKTFDSLITSDRRGDEDSNAVDWKSATRLEVNLRTKQGSVIPFLVTIDTLPDHDKIKYIIALTNITNVKSNQRKLSRIAYTDPLTSLGNRAYFYSLFHPPAGRIEYGERICCIFIDLDSFKLINDNYGHTMGDEILIIISERLKANLRESDHLARLGGDEFVVVLLDAPGDEAIREITKKLISAIHLPIFIDDTSFSLTCSVGISTQNKSDIDVDTLLKEADIAMYHAKSLGKDQHAFYHHNLSDAPLSRMFMEQGLRRALKDGSLIAHFQPIMGISGKPVAFEVLARWPHEDKGWIPPIDFIPVAEQTGMIHILGIKMLQEACIALKLLESEGAPTLRAHVNVSPKQLMKTNFVTQVLSVIEEFDVAPSQIVLEITESSMTAPDSISRISSIREHGVLLAMDDFGTGYSALSQLKDCFADIAKLDKSFLNASDNDERHTIVLERIVNLCLALHYEVLAEGVETHEHLQRTINFGCQLFQGFYFHRPMNLQDLLKVFPG